MPIAESFLGMSELGDISASVNTLLRKHRGPHACPITDQYGGQCDMFQALALQLRLIELIDGSRMSPEWRGPIEERIWS